MATLKATINLKEFDFPLISSLRGLGVMIPNVDQDREVPQPYWLENVVPTARGLASVTISEYIAASAVPTGLIDLTKTDTTIVYLIFDATGNSSYLMQYGGSVVIYVPREGVWRTIASISQSTVRLSVAFLKGRSWLFHPDLGLLTFDNGFASVPVVQTPNGISMSDIRSMTASNSYLILANNSSVYWSSPQVPTEFDPTATGINAGAGTTSVLAIKGNIQMLLPTTRGFHVYTDSNAISARSTGNSRNPWLWKEIEGAQGAFSPEHVSFRANMPAHYAWTNTGFMLLSGEGSQQIFPELTTLVSGDILERYNAATKEIEQEAGVTLAVIVTLVASRYLCISYGKEAELKEFILMYDTLLKRWGKLKIEHRAVFDLRSPKATGATFYSDLYTTTLDSLGAARFVDLLPSISTGDFAASAIAVMAANGAILKVEWADNTARGAGLIIVGGVALTRNRETEVNELRIAGLYSPEDTIVETKAHITQPTWQPMMYAPLMDTYLGEVIGKEHEVKVEGAFSLSTIEIKLVQQGVL